MPEAIEPPRHGLVGDGTVTPRPDARLVPAVMEARRCSRPQAVQWIDAHGREHAERAVRARWLNGGMQS
jgi:hypothetical protein